MNDDVIGRSTNPSLAEHIARLLSTSWRHDPELPQLAAGELAQIAPHVKGTGCAALAWWRLRRSALRDAAVALGFQQAYRYHAIMSARRDNEVQKSFEVFRKFGVEPLLVKGWAIAGAYPERGLRPYGDIDLCVRPEDYRAAELATSECGERGICVDLHDGFRAFGNAPVQPVFDRSLLIDLKGTPIRIPGAEDHFRFLCTHLLRHGLWRPLWLCDVAAALESLPERFDWDLCLTGDKTRTDGVGCVAGLANQMLDAKIDDTPFARRRETLPRWLRPAVLRQWNTCLERAQQEIVVSSLWRNRRKPGRLLANLYRGWDRPIQATVEVGAPWNNWPRTPYQIAAMFVQAPKLCRQIVSTLGK